MKRNLKVATGRIEHEIICKDEKIKCIIEKWMRSVGGDFENFVDLLELVGVKTPVKLSDLNEEKCCFKCVTSHKNEYLIFLEFNELYDLFSRIGIRDDAKCRIYSVAKHSFYNNDTLDVTLYCKETEKNGVKLQGIYTFDMCTIHLKIDDTHALIIRIDIHDKVQNKKNILRLRNYEEIDEYLLSLDSHLDIDQVYITLVQLFNFSKDCISVYIRYGETLEEMDSKLFGKIRTEKGKLLEYHILEGKEDYSIRIGGKWNYSSDGITIAGSVNDQHLRISIEDIDFNDVNSKLSEIISKVSEKIDKISEF